MLRRAVLMRDHDAAVRAAEPLARAAIGGMYAPGHDRDDLLQVARLAIARALDTYRGTPDRFPGFALMCARRQVITTVHLARADKRRAHNEALSLHAPLTDDPHGPQLQDTLHAADDVHDQFETLDTARTLLRRIARELTPTEREAMINVALGGMPYDHADEPKRVDNALQRARRKLTQPPRRRTCQPTRRRDAAA